MTSAITNVLVVGATEGSERRTFGELVSQVHQVTASSTNASQRFDSSFKTSDGSILKPKVLSKTVYGQDGVIVTLGLSDRSIKVKSFGTKATTLSIRSHGTQRIIEAMKRVVVKRLNVQTILGSGSIRNRLSAYEQLYKTLILKPLSADVEVQDLVRNSGLKPTIIKPVRLTNEQVIYANMFSSLELDVNNRTLPSQLVVQYTESSVTDPTTIGKTISLYAATC